jgi:hypothetical protein
MLLAFDLNLRRVHAVAVNRWQLLARLARAVLAGLASIEGSTVWVLCSGQAMASCGSLVN